MPRPPDPKNAEHQMRQRRYRERLARRNAPEGATVDLALAAAAAAYCDAVEAKLGSQSDRKVLQILLLGAVDLMVAAGYDRKESIAVLRRRVTRAGRPKLEMVVHASRVRDRMKQRPPLQPDHDDH